MPLCYSELTLSCILNKEPEWRCRPQPPCAEIPGEFVSDTNQNRNFNANWMIRAAFSVLPTWAPEALLIVVEGAAKVG